MLNLFATLLPGVRSLRAPLAAGYLWLLALWLVYSNDSPDRHDAEGVVDRLFELEGVASEFGVVVAVSFVAYLIGSLTEWGATAILRAIVSNRFSWLDLWVRQNIGSKLRNDKSVDFEIVRGYVEDEKFGRRWRRLELAGARTTLMLEHPLLYNEYDRLTSEAEFRTAIALPLAWIIAILALEFDSAFFVALLAVGALVLQAFQYERNGTAILAQSITSGKIPSTFIEWLRRESGSGA